MLTLVEIAGFVAVAIGAAFAGFACGGWIPGAAAGLLVAGAEAVYLANAYDSEDVNDER